MNQLSALTAVSILLFCILGCNKFGGGRANTAPPANANAERARVQKAVDVPSVVGKTIGEVKAILGPPARELAGNYTWEFPQGDLSADTGARDKKGKVNWLTFTAKMVRVDGQTVQGFPDYQSMGDLIGVDTRDSTPTGVETGETGTTRFEKFDIGGKTVDEISFSKVLGSFRSVTVRADRGY